MQLGLHGTKALQWWTCSCLHLANGILLSVSNVDHKPDCHVLTGNLTSASFPCGRVQNKMEQTKNSFNLIIKINQYLKKKDTTNHPIMEGSKAFETRNSVP